MRHFHVLTLAIFLAAAGCGDGGSGDVVLGGFDAAAGAGGTPDAATSGDLPRSGSDGGPGQVGPGSDGAGGCSGGQTACGGACVLLQVDPRNCGACGRACGGSQVCTGGVCAAGCPDPLRACSGSCVDPQSDNQNCGGCGRACPSGQGCVGGSCSRAVPVGPAPAKCAGGGPPIAFPEAAGGGCAGKMASATFKYALCSCSEIGVPTLGSDTLVDAYDSTMGPYRPGVIGGNVGANGAINASSRFEVFGDVRSAAAAGFTVASDVIVHRDLQLAGGLRVQNKLRVGGDAHVGGAVTSGSEGSIEGGLYTPMCAAVPASIKRKSCANAMATVAPPCPCRPEELVPIAARIAQYADPARNDNRAIGLDPGVFDAPGAPARLDLPCGYYYLNQIHAAGPTTIAVHGNTALFIGGSIQVSAPLIFALDAGATLDVYVGGTVFSTAAFSVGSPAYPARSRFYVGGVCKAGGATCRLDAECCSASCGGGTCGAGDGSRPFSVRLSSETRLAGLFYAPAGGFVTSSRLEMYGALFVGYYHSGSATAIHYDQAAARAGDSCPPPGVQPPPVGPPGDGGAADAARPGDAGVCVPRDEDGDGYLACDCWTPAAGCAPDDPSVRCAADCCDRPGAPGCPAGVTTPAQAAAVNPGVIDRMCDNRDDNCGMEDRVGKVTAYVCSGATASCVIE